MLSLPLSFLGAVPRALKEALVAWDHTTKSPLPVRPKAQSAAFTKTFDLADRDAFLQGHVVDNRIVIPVCCAVDIYRHL
jgi:hypothetical protein